VSAVGSSSSTGRRILVFCCGGQVALEVARATPDPGTTVIAVPRGEADVTRRECALAAVRDSRCDLVINAAAFTAVDKAEEEPEAAFAVNRDGPAVLAEICAARGLPLIHISTDYVFDGTKATAYDEGDQVNPLGVYGKSKEAGERAIREILGEHVILRTAWVFSAHRQNFVKTMLRLAESRNELRVVADQFGCPTPAGPFAEAALKIASAMGDGDWGTYHLCGAGRTSWHGFAQAIFDQRARTTGQPAPVLHPIATSEFPTPAKRPANSELDCTKLGAGLGIPPLDWRAGLAQVLREILALRDA
jgi:dTDP-4-dehydrorhamnose reductase